MLMTTSRNIRIRSDNTPLILEAVKIIVIKKLYNENNDDKSKNNNNNNIKFNAQNPYPIPYNSRL